MLYLHINVSNAMYLLYLTCLFDVPQIFYAIFDQTIFGEQSIPPKDTSAIVADLKTKHTSWKHVEGTHWQTRFSHLLNYGAGLKLFEL